MDADVGFESADAVALTQDAAVDEATLIGQFEPAAFDVLDGTVEDAPAHEMMARYLMGLAGDAFKHWQATLATLRTPQDVREYQEMQRETFLGALGGFPDRTPLNPRISGVIERDGYRIEKVLIESRPSHFVSAICFVPESDALKPPYPGVVIPCGHSKTGKSHDTYQTMGALLALNGMVALVFDPIDQGERFQIVNEAGKSKYWCTHAHNRVGVGAMLLGQNTATFEVWDGMRAIDYLQSRADVDSERIGCTGNSGGGTQTSYLMALDERIDVAGPSCYLTSFERLLATIGAQDAEQNIWGQIRDGMDHADYLIMRAPKPVIIAAGVRDFFDIDGTRATYQNAQRVFGLLGAAEQVALFENDAGHNYNRDQRRAIVEWFCRWLCDDRSPVVEPEIKPLPDEELWASPEGQVMLIEGARSVYDINAEAAAQLAAARRELWAATLTGKLLQRVAETAGVRPAAALPEPDVARAGTIERHGCCAEKLTIQPEPGIVLPAVLFTPSRPSQAPAVLYLDEQGKSHAAFADDGPVATLLAAGRTVLAVDVRGTGETQGKAAAYFSPEYGGDGKDTVLAYLLGRSYVGMQAEDVLVCAKWLQQGVAEHVGVELVAAGNVSVAALHAAVLDSYLFEAVQLTGMVTSWSDVVCSKHTTNQFVTAVHGALQLYDLPELVRTLGSKVTVTQPRDVNGRPL